MLMAACCQYCDNARESTASENRRTVSPIALHSVIREQPPVPDVRRVLRRFKSYLLPLSSAI